MNNGHHPKRELQYVALEQTEEAWDELRKFFVGTRGFIPPPSLGTAAVAKTDTGKIVSGVVLQMLPYIGPLKVDPEWEARVDFRALKRVIDNSFTKRGTSPLIIQGYVGMISDPRVANIAEFAGMRRINPIVLIEDFNESDGIPV